MNPVHQFYNSKKLILPLYYFKIKQVEEEECSFCHGTTSLNPAFFCQSCYKSACALCLRYEVKTLCKREPDVQMKVEESPQEQSQLKTEASHLPIQKSPLSPRNYSQQGPPNECMTDESVSYFDYKQEGSPPVSPSSLGFSRKVSPQIPSPSKHQPRFFHFSFGRCLTGKCRLLLGELELEETSDVLLIRSLQQKNVYSDLDEQTLLCSQCKQQFPKEKLLAHYKNECPYEDGVACSGAPFCKVVGTRKNVVDHEVNCPYIKYPCEKCGLSIVRKLEANHHCFELLSTRLYKLERTLDFAKSRLEHQTNAHANFANIVTNVHRKMTNLNRKLDKIVFAEQEILDPNKN